MNCHRGYNGQTCTLQGVTPSLTLRDDFDSVYKKVRENWKKCFIHTEEKERKRFLSSGFQMIDNIFFILFSITYAYSEILSNHRLRGPSHVAKLKSKLEVAMRGTFLILFRYLITSTFHYVQIYTLIKRIGFSLYIQFFIQRSSMWMDRDRTSNKSLDGSGNIVT